MIQNLEQIRAAHAHEARESCTRQNDEGDALSGYPSLIINNGLIATLAFSLEKGGQPQRIADAIAGYFASLNDSGNALLLESNGGTATHLLEKLQKSDAYHLRRCTDEALAYLAYLKRFVRN